MCDIRYFKNAYNDYKVATDLLKNADADEFYINTIAYHLQQAVEKTLKGFLECVGVTVPNTHAIDKLVQMSKNNGSMAVITEWLEDSVDMLTRWEVETRYNLDFTIEKQKVSRSHEKIGEFLRLNGLSYELREELKDENIRKKLIDLLPVSKKDCDVFELNCFYQVYKRRLKEK